ncbi:MAG: hypothetical protein ACC608_09905 [Anaerofustis sp.]
MKKKKRLILSVSLLFAVSLISFILLKPSGEEVYAKDFLNKLYNVSDYQITSYLTNAKSEDNDSVTITNNDFTEEGYNQAVSERITEYYEEYAYENKCTIAVNYINTKEEKYNVNEGLWYFTFDAQIVITYSETNEQKTVSQLGTITILSKDGTYKVQSIDIENMDDIQS